MTYVAVFKPYRGAWTLESLDRSPLVAVRHGSMLADPHPSGQAIAPVRV